MLAFIVDNWLDLLLTLVGLSAFAVHYIEKRDRLKVAATLVINQIDEIEDQISTLKHQPHLNMMVIYHAKAILLQNTWEEYKHLFTKKLDKSEYNRIQSFFDNAEKVERVRTELVDMTVTAWHDKSAVTHQKIAELITQYKDKPDQLVMEISAFRKSIGEIGTEFSADVTIQSLAVGLNNYYPLGGTTAYKKLKAYSFHK